MPHLDRVTLHPERYPTREVYPFCLPLLQQTPSIDLSAPVTMFVGENGTGKSTVLDAIARRCRLPIWEYAEGGRVAYNPYEHALGDYLGVQWTRGPAPGSFFSAQIFRQFAILLDGDAVSDPGQLQYFGGHSLMSLSHGQSLMSYFRARYARTGLYLLDEPETALSPRSLLELARLLRAMADAGHAQFIVCTHSPILLACPGARIYSFDRTPIAAVRYEETEHYRLYKAFMADPAACLAQQPAQSTPESEG